jgi:tRNA A-37 threonylcarbamoyl transferase component Bud32
MHPAMNTDPHVDTVSYPDSQPKAIVAGHELQRELARGGLGVVYLAYHPLLLDFRAIKRPQLRPGLDRDLVLARFRKEVQAVGSLRHDHIIRAHDAGADADGPYLVMEYLNGVSLKELVKQHGPMPTAEACALIRQAALGLQAAHDRDLVHRDIKPSNLMLARVNPGTARVVVIDWGLVKRMGEPSSPGLLGTPDYMSPEQIQNSQGVDIRADIYSLGVTLYYLLTGAAPFQDRINEEKLVAHQKEPFPAISRSEIPAAASAILSRMVAKDPADRFATPREVADALLPFCGADARLIGLLEGKAGETTPLAPKWRIGWKVALAAAFLMLTLMSIGFLLVALNSQRQNQQNNVGPGELGGGSAKSEILLDKHTGKCTSMAFLADGKYAVSENGGGEIYVWDLAKRHRKEPIPHGFGKPTDQSSGVIAASTDGRFVAAGGVNDGAGGMNALRLYDQRTMKLLDQDFVFIRLGHPLAFSPDGAKLATVDLPGVFNQFLRPVFGPGKIAVSIHDVQTRDIKSFKVDTPINHLAFSPDGAFLLTCSDEANLQVWNLKENRHERTIAAHQEGADQVGYSADGTRIYSASSADDSLRVWANDQTSKEVMKIGLDKMAKMTRCAFWPGGRGVTGHADGSLVLWDLQHGKELHRFANPDAPITALAISPDGQQALSAHSDHRVFLYRLPSIGKP